MFVVCVVIVVCLVGCSVFVAWFWFMVVSCLLFAVVYDALFVVCRSLVVVCCLLCVGCSLMLDG